MAQKSKHSVAPQQVLEGGVICCLPNLPHNEHYVFTQYEQFNFVLSSNPPLLHVHTENSLLGMPKEL